MPKAKSSPKTKTENLLTTIIEKLNQQNETLLDLKIVIEEMGSEIEELGARILDIENHIAE